MVKAGHRHAYIQTNKQRDTRPIFKVNKYIYSQYNAQNENREEKMKSKACSVQCTYKSNVTDTERQID